MKVAIRADASRVIGSGHIIRCLTLAGRLAEGGADVYLLSRSLPPHLAQLVTDAGHALIALEPAEDQRATAEEALPDEQQRRDAADVRAVLSGTTVDWLVVDHYGLGTTWEESARGIANRLMVIDDLARSHQCDLLLDQNFYLSPKDRYRTLVPANARLLLGPRYALLRPEFADLAACTPPRDSPVKRILLFMGGIDRIDATSTALDALSRIDLGGASLDVVIGSAHPRRTAIEARCATMTNTTCHVDTPHMAALAAAADLAIGAGGTATWERCALGVPTLAICLADNQRELLENASRAGLLYAPDRENPDADELARHIQALLASSGLRNHLSRTAAALVDGRGARRVVAAMAPVAITMRPAVESDCRSLYDWRNHPAVRGVSRESAEIAFSDHQAWFSRVLQDDNRDLLIGELDGQPVGVIRLDRQGVEAEVSIYLVPQRIGQGAGPGLLLAAENWLKSSRPQVKLVRAAVLEGNAASLQLFERCGYARDSIHFSKRVSS